MERVSTQVDNGSASNCREHYGSFDAADGGLFDGVRGLCPLGDPVRVRPLSAEQLLSHILPPLAAGNPDRLSARVEPDSHT